jgi:U6 snRNA-associated Sm-like protein LSm3
MSQNISSTKPFDYLTALVGKYVQIKCRNSRQIKAVLNAYDDHLNLLVSNVTETGTSIDGVVEDRSFDVMYVRGDGIIGITKVDESEI